MNKLMTNKSNTIVKTDRTCKTTLNTDTVLYCNMQRSKKIPGGGGGTWDIVLLGEGDGEGVSEAYFW